LPDPAVVPAQAGRPLPVTIPVPFEIHLRTLRQRGHVAGGAYVGTDGRLLSEPEYRRIAGGGRRPHH
jgi:hypothetical protein